MEREERIKETRRSCRCFYRLGPSTVLMTFAYALKDAVFTDLTVYRTCLVSLNINKTECFMLRHNAGSPEALDLETRVEPHASMIVMANSLIACILPAVLSLFLGPWSDRVGRKPLFLASSTGFASTFVLLSLTCDWDISPWYMLLSLLPASIMGGWRTILLASICHISDTTEEKDKTMKLTMLEGSICCGTVLGMSTAPLIYNNYGCTNLFRVAAACSILALVYTYFCIPETVENASKESMRGLFKISSVKELITCTLVKRDGFNPSIFWLGISTLTAFAMTKTGLLTVEFLFARIRLGWNVRDYSHFSIALYLLRITGIFIASLLGKVLGIPDTLLSGLGILSALIASIAKSLAWKSWHMYLSLALEMFNGVIAPTTRAIISKFVPDQDIGKVFSLATFLEAASALGGTPLYTIIYSHYLPPIYPAPVFLLSTVIFILLTLFSVCIHRLVDKSRRSSIYIAASQDDN